MNRHARSFCRFLLPGLLAALPVQATQWIGSSGDTFNAGSSWNGGVAPHGSSSTAEFGANAVGVNIELIHTIGTFHFQTGYLGGGLVVRNGGSLTLVTGIVNDSAYLPDFTIRNGLVFFSGPSPTLGNARFTVESAGTLKLLTYAHPNGSAARINLTGGNVTANNPTDGGSVSLGELKGTSGMVLLTGVRSRSAPSAPMPRLPALSPRRDPSPRSAPARGRSPAPTPSQVRPRSPPARSRSTTPPAPPSAPAP
jgi:hypothetical protein